MKTFLKSVGITVLLSFIALNAYAESSITDVMKKINDDMRETRQKEGFNINGGVTVVQSSQIHVSDKIKSQWTKDRFEQKNKGYISIYSDRAKELVQLTDSAPFKYKASKKNKDKTSSIFRKKSSEISMAYEFTPIPRQNITKVYGFSGGNTYKNGWTGIVEFFNVENIGNCAYTENNVSITHQAAKVDEAVVSYDVNGKVTVVTIEGNKESGYLYQVDWFDKNYFHTLECANQKYSNFTKDLVIALTQKIDEK